MSGILRKFWGLPFKPYKIFHSGKSDSQTRRQDVITEFISTASLVTPPFCDVFKLNHVFRLADIAPFSMQCELRILDFFFFFDFPLRDSFTAPLVKRPWFPN